MKRGFWIVAVLLITINLTIDYKYFYSVQTDYIFAEIFEFAFLIALPIVIGLLMGSLIAIIPFKKLYFKKKLAFTFPLSTILAAGIYTYSIATIAYHQEITGKKFGPVKFYGKINIPDGLDCSLIKEGVFETDNLIIERNGHNQIQTNKETGEVRTYNIIWKSNCEYYLEEKNEQLYLKVKIVEIYDDSYDCYVAKDNTAQRYRIKNNYVR